MISFKTIDRFEHNYNLKLLRMEAEGKVPHGPGLWHIDIRHDDWCGGLRGKRCNCDPDIRFVDHATWEREHE
jgi:hypothetical protein